MYRILVAVDGSDGSNRAAAFAIDLARRLDDAELQLVNVQEPVEESQTHGLGRDAIRQHRQTLAVESGAVAGDMAEKAGIRHAFEWHFGDPARVLADIADSSRCNLMVIGTQGAGSVQNLLLGSVAQKALHLSSVPIALIK